MKLSAADAIKIIARVGFFALMFLMIGDDKLQGPLVLMVQGIVTIIVGWQPLPQPAPAAPETQHDAE